jgi:hypothetical protein
MIPEEVDLAELTESLRRELRPGEPVGYLRGKSLMRDVLVARSGYSVLEAEELVDTLEMRGYLRFLGDPSERSVADSHWAIGVDAGA